MAALTSTQRMEQCGISVEMEARAYVNSFQEQGRSSDKKYFDRLLKVSDSIISLFSLQTCRRLLSS